MARATKTYNCFLASVTAIAGWEKLGKAGVPTTAEALTILNKENVETETPSTATGLEVEANKKAITGKFTMPTLAEGEIPIKISMHVYGKAKTAALDVKFAPVTGLQEMNSTTTQWWKTVLTSVEGKRLTELETWEIESIKIQGGIVYAAYLEMETETERSNILTATSGLTFTGAASAGGVVETSGLTGVAKVGETVSLVTAGIASGATSVTDPRSNTYTKDEEHAFTGLTVQFWSTKVTTEIKAADKITLSGFTALTKAVADAIVMFPLQSTSNVDVAVNGEGIGEAFEVTSAALRATQGDMLRVISVALGEATSFNTSGSSAEITPDPGGLQKEAGLSMQGAWTKRPPENAAFVIKGKWNASFTYAVVAVAYKVLATTAAAEGNPMTMMI